MARKKPAAAFMATAGKVRHSQGSTHYHFKTNPMPIYLFSNTNCAFILRGKRGPDEGTEQVVCPAAPGWKRIQGHCAEVGLFLVLSEAENVSSR